MAIAFVLTFLAFCGIAGGVFLGQSRTPSAHLAAAGGGLLSGISLFWLLPEIAAESGWIAAVLLVGFGCAVLWVLEHSLNHGGHQHHDGIAGPLLAATAVHSFLDGWSIQVFSAGTLARVAVPLGLALHKVPEGLALGLLIRKSISSPWKAFTAACSVEALTLAGAWIEPEANRSGIALLGIWWTEIVLGIVAGTFLYLGFHATVPARAKQGVVPIFLLTVCLVAIAALLHWRMGLA